MTGAARWLRSAAPNLAALFVLVGHALTADEFDRLRAEPPSFHLAVAIVCAVFAWAALRGLTWVWTR